MGGSLWRQGASPVLGHAGTPARMEGEQYEQNKRFSEQEASDSVGRAGSGGHVGSRRQKSRSRGTGGGSSTSSEELRLHLLLGHLLLLTTGGLSHSLHGTQSPPAPGMPPFTPGSLPAIVADLQRRQLLPGWMATLLTQQPSWFEAAFERQFSQEIAATSVQEPSVTHFWTPRSQKSANAALTSRDRTGHKAGSQLDQAGASHASGMEQAPKPGFTSRYRSDFKDEQLLGKGGFGHVVAATNVLDGLRYAIKKIKLTSTPLLGSSRLREVHTLSRLQHPNVVRYFQAWSEPLPPDEEQSVQGDDDEGGEWGAFSNTTGETPSINSPYHSSKPHFTPGAQRQLMASHISEESSEEDSTIVFQPSGAPDISRQDQGGLSEQTKHHPAKPAQPRFTNVLYIQMEFCRSTLAKALKAGPLPEEERWHVLRGILQGLAHLHAAGIIHRDLKPDNVFYSSKNEIKIGDLGLSKVIGVGEGLAQQQISADLQPRSGPPSSTTAPAPDQSPPPAPGQAEARGAPANGGGGSARVEEGKPGAMHHLSKSLPSEQTGVIGTSFYIAPEILEGWPSYDEKVDLFSLGVCIFELWHPFTTEMERVVHLRALRESGHMPETWKAQHPHIASMVSWCMRRSPEERPTAAEVLSTFPPRQDEQAVGDLLRLLPEAPETASRVLTGVFELGAARSATHQDAAGAGEPMPDAVAAKEAVLGVVRSIFGRYGAVPMSSKEVGYARAPPSHKDAVHLLANGGALLGLRRDLRTPFVSWLAQQAAAGMGGGSQDAWHMGSAAEGSLRISLPIDCLRRYEVAIIHKQARDQELPSSICVADFDIVQAHSKPALGSGSVGGSSTQGSAAHSQPGAAVAAAAAASRERLLGEGQVLKAVTQVLEAVLALGTPTPNQSSKGVSQLLSDTPTFEVRISHRVLLSSILASCGVAPGQATDQVLAQLRTALSISPAESTAGPARASKWASIQKALEGLKLRADSISRVRTALLVLPGPLLPSLDRTSAFIKDWNSRAVNHPASLAAASRAAAAVAELQLLARYMSILSIPSCLMLDPLMPLPEAYFSHTYFTVHVRVPHPNIQGAGGTTTQMMVAAGGRYDTLVRSCWPTSLTSAPQQQQQQAAASSAGMAAAGTAALSHLADSHSSFTSGAHLPPGAVGATLNINKLMDLLGLMQQGRSDLDVAGKSAAGSSLAGLAAQHPLGTLTPMSALRQQHSVSQHSTAQILVASRSRGELQEGAGSSTMLEARLQVVAMCWAAGLNAELMPRAAPSLTEQYEWAASRNIRLLVILDPAKHGEGWPGAGAFLPTSGSYNNLGQLQWSGSGRAMAGLHMVKVKSAPGAGGTKVDELVPLADLTSRLTALLSPHGPSLALPPLVAPASPAAAAAGASAAAMLGAERGFHAPGLLPEDRQVLYGRWDVAESSQQLGGVGGAAVAASRDGLGVSQAHHHHHHHHQGHSTHGPRGGRWERAVEKGESRRARD